MGGKCGPTLNNCNEMVPCSTMCAGTGATCGGGGVNGVCGCRPELPERREMRQRPQQLWSHRTVWQLLRRAPSLWWWRRPERVRLHAGDEGHRVLGRQKLQHGAGRVR
jgi:hypothetical protein